MLMTGTTKQMKPASERPLRLSRISAVKRHGMDADTFLAMSKDASYKARTSIGCIDGRFRTFEFGLGPVS